MREVGAHRRLGRVDHVAMAGQEEAVIALKQALQRLEIIAHMPGRRRHDARVPAHDVIAGEHEIGGAVLGV